ncbi:hypothetical protein A2348_02095 [Candidatus Uhrbacteria bacterium RIFOXYB12_FULL_58_10]|uniref:HTH arsR-type domain-containing protein n=1 Tax=Candidatus Uhrbacteria bacterium RIFOXYB2_FULL_57_15 TaxID=1802422 RepID=A0A1F7W702_9BACT|nr:MAG: hypothetical protein A2348_02095 [Candidatus Uhrbacteria bacterium RIFOXYB12_FULL_58_10]OGL98550.1 MAG: hypothetical protein A2304_04245 [Candidatus Uhrbacteria bacterium RIFOXYB2_FULL_57_15]
MPTSLIKLLENLGLSKREADVYLASLRLGESAAQDIAHATGLTRTTVASVLDRLASQGFVSVHRKAGKRLYWIEDPHILVEHERARLTVVEELAGRLHSEYHRADKKPDAEVTDASEAIVNMMVRVIDELPDGAEIRTIESPNAKHYQAVMSDELFLALTKRKAAKGIRTRSLVPAGSQSAIRPSALQKGIEVRGLPPGILFESSLWLFGSSLVLFSGTHTFAVRVNHRHMNEGIGSIFEYLWDQSQVHAQTVR